MYKTEYQKYRIYWWYWKTNNQSKTQIKGPIHFTTEIEIKNKSSPKKSFTSFQQIK